MAEDQTVLMHATVVKLEATTEPGVYGREHYADVTVRVKRFDFRLGELVVLKFERPKQ